MEKENLVVDTEAEEVEEKPKKPYLSKETATRFANNVRQKLCKNAKVWVEEDEEMLVQTGEGRKEMLMNYTVKGDFCEKERRNGSAFCQECSDKHKENI